MRIQYIKSAGVVVEHDGHRLLCDPWLTDGIYYGSWYHFPPLKFQPEDFDDVDYIYITHIHPDHLDPASLRRMRKSIPILIHNYSEKFVFNILRRLGFKNVIEVSHKEKFQISPDFSIEILAADNCDPTVCGLYFQCAVPQPYQKTMQIDSMAIFRGGGKIVVNTNDCPYGLSKTLCRYIASQHPSIDFLLAAYSGAGPYPQCFANLDDRQKMHELQVHRSMKLNDNISFIKDLNPKAFLPFAGQYILGGRLAPLNRFLSPPKPEELVRLFAPLLEQAEVEAKMVQLNSGEYYDVDKETVSLPFSPPDPVERLRYIDEVLSHKKFDYEDTPESDPANWVDLTDKLNMAYEKMHARQKEHGIFKSDWHIYIDAGQGYYYQVPLTEGKKVEKVYPNELVVPFLRIGLDYSLLVRILDRKAHWNNAEVGSHLRFFREPNKYDRSIHWFMSYFHC